jgi:hypothetical protein
MKPINLAPMQAINSRARDTDASNGKNKSGQRSLLPFLKPVDLYISFQLGCPPVHS